MKRATALSLAVFVAAACGGPQKLGGRGATCFRDDDCEAGMICVAPTAGDIHRVCSTDATPLISTVEGPPPVGGGTAAGAAGVAGTAGMTGVSGAATGGNGASGTSTGGNASAGQAGNGGAAGSSPGGSSSAGTAVGGVAGTDTGGTTSAGTASEAGAPL